MTDTPETPAEGALPASPATEPATAPAETPAEAPKAAPEGERIAKVIARAGVASRRDAEKMILAGRVTVNGKPVRSPALDVIASDKVAIDGTPIEAPQQTRLWLYYKPLGLVTTEKDEQGRRTIFDEMPEGMPRVLNVGRLDLNSEGLLLLTNDGGLKRRLELPETAWLRKYRVRVNGRPTDETFAPLRRGTTIDGEEFLPMEIALDRQQGANAWLTVGLREGKNREIRRAMAEIGLTVNRLIRLSYGPFRLNEMQPGDVIEVKRKVLRDQLGDWLLTGEEGGRPALSERFSRDEDSERSGKPGPRRFGKSPARGGEDRPHRGFGRQEDFADGEGRPPRRPYRKDEGDRPEGKRGFGRSGFHDRNGDEERPRGRFSKGGFGGDKPYGKPRRFEGEDGRNEGYRGRSSGFHDRNGSEDKPRGHFNKGGFGGGRASDEGYRGERSGKPGGYDRKPRYGAGEGRSDYGDRKPYGKPNRFEGENARGERGSYERKPRHGSEEGRSGFGGKSYGKPRRFEGENTRSEGGYKQGYKGHSRPERDGSERPEGRSYGDKKYGDRKPGGKTYGDRKFGDRKFGDNGPRDRNFGDKSYGDRKPSHSGAGDRPFPSKRKGGFAPKGKSYESRGPRDAEGTSRNGGFSSKGGKFSSRFGGGEGRKPSGPRRGPGPKRGPSQH